MSPGAEPAGTNAPARRVGVLGGSFDPPHLAHLALARLALQALALDELRWLPAGVPWQKADRQRAPGELREAMLRLLIAGEPRFTVDTRELRRAGLTYTIDTVRELNAEAPGTEWWLVIGQDQYRRFDTWRDWPEIVARFGLAVAARAGEAPQAPPAVAAVPHRVQVLHLPSMDIAASDIRTRCAEGREIASLVGQPVARYIDQHALYTGRPRS
jgi:nicotinate-nucleotide adenylyltransferase